jgi:hypothetical protein
MTDHKLVVRSGRRRWAAGAAGLLACSGLMVAIVSSPPAIAAGASGGQKNQGDVWLDNVGNPAGPGHSMDPHLSCTDINLWGDGLADTQGTFSVDGWSPSGSGSGDFNQPGYHQDQAWPNDSAHSSLPPSGGATWTYTASGAQVIAVINVQMLVAHAIANGDVAQPQQGFHFKLQFSQGPQKHKTFWVKCTTPTPTPDPTGQVKAISTPSTGAGTPAKPVGLVLVLLGGALMTVARWRGTRTDSI